MLIFLVFCVVVFGGGPVVLIFLVFLCCGIWWGSAVLIFLVFCVVVFGGVRVVNLFSFLCCPMMCYILISVHCNGTVLFIVNVFTSINNFEP